MHNYQYFISKANPKTSASVSLVKPVWRQGFAQAELTTPQSRVRTKSRLGEGHAFVMCRLHSRNSFKSSMCPKTTGRDQTGWQLAQRRCLDDQPTALGAHRLGNPLLCSLLQQHFCFVPPRLENPPLSTLKGAWFVYSNHFR